MPEITLAEALNQTLKEQMRKDDRIVVLGEDIGKRGGVFLITEGLIDEFGPERVRNTPISENAIIGAAIGAALTGMRPVAEIMFADFLMDAMDPIVNTMAKIRFMTGGQAKVPMVVRTPSGAGLSAGAQHSQSPEAIFMHIPGIRIAVPSTPYDMKGLLKTAIRIDDPVLFFEHKMLYYEGGEVPDKEYTIPFGKADIKRKGKDVTVVAILAMVKKAMMAADMLAGEGIEIEVVDPMTLNPLDMDTIINSVKKTKRLITVEEGARTGGIGAEISARVAEEALDYLDAPIKRLGGMDCPIPFSPALEELMYPTEESIVNAVKQILG